MQPLPKGYLTLSRTKKYYKWYHSDGHTREYIPKKKRALAIQLALKNYLSLLLHDLTIDHKAIQLYLNYHDSHPHKSEDMLANNPEIQSLLSSYFAPQSEELALWATESYETNPTHLEHLLFKCSSGHMVRSKSEEVIDMLLFFKKIPFRYEAPLTLGYTTLYPDFTIRHPKTGEFYYWEHFGLIDDPQYARNAYSKMELYTSHGIIPTINLITTFETRENPLSADVIEKTIEYYFL